MMTVCKLLNITVYVASTPIFTTGHCRCLVTFSTPNPCMKKILFYVELNYVVTRFHFVGSVLFLFSAQYHSILSRLFLFITKI